MKIDIYRNKAYKNMIKSSELFEASVEGQYYKNIICLKETPEKVRKDTLEKAFFNIKNKIVNSFEEIEKHNFKKLCVLPKNHSGRCCSNPITDMLLKNKTTDKIITKIKLSIMTTPGADDYVIKNRASRLFPIVLTNYQEKKIKNKNQKLRAAISLREFTTPFCLATAYIDWMVYMLNVRDLKKYFRKTSKYMDIYQKTNVLTTHKTYLQKYFQNRNRKAFNDRNNTICSVTRKEINVKDIGDPDRDNRIVVSQEDVQMGHLIPRNEDEITIRGLNLSIMTREGNRIIGDYVLFENKWIEILKNIVTPY